MSEDGGTDGRMEVRKITEKGKNGDKKRGKEVGKKRRRKKKRVQVGKKREREGDEVRSEGKGR